MEILRKYIGPFFVLVLGALAVYLVYFKITNQKLATADIATSITQTDGTGQTSGTPTTNVSSATNNSTAQTVQEVSQSVDSAITSTGSAIVANPTGISPLFAESFEDGTYLTNTLQSQAY